MGAVIGTIFAEAAVCVCQTVMVRKALEIRRYLRATLPFLLLGGGMYLLILWLDCLPFGSALTLVVQILAGGAVYSLACGAYLVRFQHISLDKFLPKRRRKGDV